MIYINYNMINDIFLLFYSLIEKCIINIFIAVRQSSRGSAINNNDNYFKVIFQVAMPI